MRTWFLGKIKFDKFEAFDYSDKMLYGISINDGSTHCERLHHESLTVTTHGLRQEFIDRPGVPVFLLHHGGKSYETLVKTDGPFGDTQKRLEALRVSTRARESG